MGVFRVRLSAGPPSQTMANGNDYHRFHYLPHWNYPRRLPGLTGLYLNTLLRVLAMGLIGIFIPVFVFKIGGGWEALFIFYFIKEFFLISTTIPTAILIKKWGPDLLTGIAAFTQLLALIFLIKSQASSSYLYWAAMFLGIAIPLHWIPYHLAFSQESTRKIISRQLVTNALFSKLAAAIAPLTGGVIITLFGFSTLYLTAGIILALSILPIFADQYNQRGESFSLAKTKKTFREKKLYPLWRGFIGVGIETTIYGIFWPIFLYNCFGNLEKMGLLSTISLLSSVAVLSYLGKNGQKKARKFFRFGIITSAPNWLIRTLISSFLPLVMVDILYQLTTMFIWIPVGSLVYHWGRIKEKSFFVIRELAIHLGVLITLGMALLIYYLQLNWRAIFLLSILGLIIVSNFYHGFQKNK